VPQTKIVFFKVPLNRSDQEDKDYLIFQARTEMRYGLSSDLEVYGYVRGSYLDGGQSTDYEVIYKRNPVTKKMDPYHVRTWQDTFKFDDLSLGLKYQFSPDNDTPALLGYLETAVVENTSYVSAKPRIDYGEAWQAGLTTYRQFRPAVLSLALGYHHTPSRKTHYYTYDRYRFNHGDTFYVNTAIDVEITPKSSGAVGITFIEDAGTNANVSWAVALTEKTILAVHLSYGLSGDNNPTTGGFNLGYAF